MSSSGTTNQKLEKYKEETETLNLNLTIETQNWNDIIKNLAHKLKGDIKNLIETQAEIISYKQILIDQIRKYALEISKNQTNIKVLKKLRFEFYSGGGYQLTIKNSGDKSALIEADIVDIQYRTDILDVHISYLRETGDNLKTMDYTVKNRIQLMDTLGAS